MRFLLAFDSSGGRTALCGDMLVQLDVLDAALNVQLTAWTGT
jgi:hypothetical protein